MAVAPFELQPGAQEHYDHLAELPHPYTRWVKETIDEIASETDAALAAGVDAHIAMHAIADYVVSQRPQISELLAGFNPDAQTYEEIQVGTPASFAELRAYNAGLIVQELAICWTHGREFNDLMRLDVPDLPIYYHDAA